MKYGIMTKGEASMATALKVSRVQKKGQVTIPLEIREKLGVQEGDFVAFVVTSEGILISPQQVIPAKTLDEVESHREDKGLKFEEFFGFSQRIARQTIKEEKPIEIPRGKSIAEITFGAFAPGRSPEDFGELRRQFIEDVVQNTISEAQADQDQPL